jgi:cytochrome P450
MTEAQALWYYDPALYSVPLHDPTSREFRDNPYPQYHKLRQYDPVHFYAPAGCWMLTRYQDIRAVLFDPRFGIALDWLEQYPHVSVQMQQPFNRIIRTQILSGDPPAHTRIRGIMSRWFTPSRLDALRPVIQQSVDECIDDALAAGTFDFISGFAYRMPFRVICQMMGVPVEEREPLEGFTHALMRSTDPTPMSAVELADCNGGAVGFRDYFLDLARRRHAEITEAAVPADIFSEMVRARDQGAITEEEMISNFILLFCAGHDTVVNLFGNGLLALFRNRDQLEILRADPSLMRGAVEELLRYDTTLQIARRTALEWVKVGADPTGADPQAGKWIAPGHYVVCCLGAANRDPEVFENPDQLNVRRKNVKPLSFGGGIHTCLGAQLARIEGEIGFSTLLRRIPELELETLDPVWRQNTTIRGLEALPARCTRAVSS